MKPVRILLFVFILIALVLVGRALFSKKVEPTTTVFVDTVTQLTTATTVTAEATPMPTANVAIEALNPHEKEQLQVLAEIFKTKNDNDPRMDQMLKNFSESVKAALRQQYKNTKAEMRNELGTISFLIGRELKEGRGSSADVQFLKEVLMEKPCLSLVDCSRPASGQSPEEQHLEAIHETTAHYPQLMDLRCLKQALEGDTISPALRAEAMAALEAARNSPNPRVVQEAQAILNSLSKN